mmetsp:Transcript_30673/g.65813  ORF Transcript_30673/g.65813 Transcript_30673/m.65813 type:complete len:218 (-) Transcript_30673:162-815(-)|eukprot:CAMPEP_0201123762 /NCGR_PEP_ID=MMETSP0850-20130426/9073_1 /ASSEMBLY_ACC=CAM_ASM_000622 /TAXON_ID=183588 /ORGANISM="Pseudo-nitzschia fraudulenta, Strain WWA7" /LENGTH=217 /DNA_ID=CAMNT_0047390831 /DNA_START=215 /DNA_END=868 /DNA_ORIENTATION=+
MRFPTSLIANGVGSSRSKSKTAARGLSGLGTTNPMFTSVKSLSTIQVAARSRFARATTTAAPGRKRNVPTVPVWGFRTTRALESRRLLSASAAALKEEPPRRRSLETKDPIVLTERAADRIKKILQGENARGALGIRLGVKRRGCNGLSYTLNYAFEKPKKDIEMQSNGVKVFVEPMALFNVVGTVMDWEETELSSEFTFKNPNSKGECGCGESFTV